MYIKRHLSPLLVYLFTWRMLLFSIITGSIAYVIYDYAGWKWVAIPWLPVSLVGTATAFFVGFKNNQSYDRFWEARKVWGSITNLSRAFSSASRSFITNDSSSAPLPEEKVKQEIKTLLHRHIGWLYALCHAMDQRTSWEHVDIASIRQRRATHRDKNNYDEEIRRHLSEDEIKWIETKNNACTHILDKQTKHLARLHREGLLEDLRHVELQQMITALYAEQGASERIKNTPFPRQYATSSTIFIIIFSVLLPFAMISEFNKLGEEMLWLVIPFNVVVTWVFTLMEYMGDISENPFEGLLTDVPIRTIIRNIEVDILDMLDEKDLPEKAKPVFGTIF